MIIRRDGNGRLMVPYETGKGYLVFSPGLNIIEKAVWEKIKAVPTVSRDIDNNVMIIESTADGDLIKSIPSLKAKSMASATELIKCTSEKDVLMHWGKTADPQLQRLITTQIEKLKLRAEEHAGAF